jgi:hypothetical protein
MTIDCPICPDHKDSDTTVAQADSLRAASED